MRQNRGREETAKKINKYIIKKKNENNECRGIVTGPSVRIGHPPRRSECPSPRKSLRAPAQLAQQYHERKRNKNLFLKIK
jgi:hypothetical protein